MEYVSKFWQQIQVNFGFQFPNYFFVFNLKLWSDSMFLSFLFSFLFFHRSVLFFLFFFFSIRFTPSRNKISHKLSSKRWTRVYKIFKVWNFGSRFSRNPFCMIQEPQDFQESIQENSRNSKFLVQKLQVLPSNKRNQPQFIHKTQEK